MKAKNTIPKQKCCFSWTKLFLSALFPLIFGIFTIVYTVQQDSIARANLEQDQAQTDELRKQTVFDSYIDNIAKLLLRPNFNRSDLNNLRDIRVKTLNALRQLDPERKRDIVLFLYENQLIRGDRYRLQKLVSLEEGDLSGIEFVRSPTLKRQLDYLHLPGILAVNIIFDGYLLRNVLFDNASMSGAKFIKSILSYSTFVNTNLTEALFDENNMRNVNFSGAILACAKIRTSKVEKANFTNADLLGSDFDTDQLTNLDSRRSNIFLNTRFPNGSFSAIDSSQLIADASAELMCTTGRTPWKTVIGFDNVSVVDKSKEINSPIAPIDGNCFFKCHENSRAWQSVDVQRFSLLIDSGQGRYNLSAHFGCLPANRTDQVYVRIDYATEEDVDVNSSTIKSNRGQSPFHFKHRPGRIPIGIRELYVNIGADIKRTNMTNMDEPYCLIDDIKLFIFKIENEEKQY